MLMQFDLRTKASTELFTCHSTLGRRRYRPVVQLNTIAIDPMRPNLFAVGGSDEYTRVYDIRKYKWDGSTDFDQPINYYCPEHLVGNEKVGITGLAFSDQSELLVSYNNEQIYLFTKDMGWGPNPAPSSPLSTCSDADEPGPDDSSGAVESVMDTDNRPVPQVFKGHINRETVKGVSFFGPKSEYVVSGSDCGRICIWRKKDGELIRVMEADKHVVNCIEAHPHTAVLASSGIENDIKIWTPKAEEKAILPANIDEVFPLLEFVNVLSFYLCSNFCFKPASEKVSMMMGDNLKIKRSCFSCTHQILDLSISFYAFCLSYSLVAHKYTPHFIRRSGCFSTSFIPYLSLIDCHFGKS